MPTIDYFQGGPAMGREDSPPFKPGEPAKHGLGVMYQGPWSIEGDGFAEHTRRCARALASVGCPVHLRSPGLHVTTGVPKELPPDVGHLLTASIGKYSAIVNQTIPRAVTLQGLTTHRYMTLEEIASINQYRVISTVFERDRVSPSIVDSLKKVGQVWVACQQNADVLRQYGVAWQYGVPRGANICVVPVPHFPDDPLLTLRGRERRPGPVRFYHIGKWEPRKAQDKILKAFLRAFKPGQAHLIFKYTPIQAGAFLGHPESPQYVINDLLMHDAAVQKNGWTPETVNVNIELISKRLAESAITALHRFGDVYVTLSRGEGFDMPAYDAKLAGNLMVYTPSGGPQDFCEEADVLVQGTTDHPCHSSYDWEPDACYLDYDDDDAMQAMRVACSRVLAGMRSERKLEEFSAEAVGRKMLSNLERLVQPGKVFE